MEGGVAGAGDGEGDGEGDGDGAGAGAGDGAGDVPPDDPGVLPGDDDEPGVVAGAGACASCALLAEALPPHDVIISVEKLKTIAKPAADKNLRNRLLLGDFANQCVNLKDTHAFASQEKT